MMNVSQLIMLYTLNLYSAVCQLYLNKIERKRSQPQNDPDSGIIRQWFSKSDYDYAQEIKENMS